MLLWATQVKIYCIAVRLYLPSSPYDQLGVVPAQLDDKWSRIPIPAAAIVDIVVATAQRYLCLDITQVKLEVFAIVEKPRGLEHLRVCESRTIPPRQETEGSVALIDHWS